VGAKVTGKAKKRKAEKDAEEIVPASDEEPPEEPKPKKVKPKMHEAINTVVANIEENKSQENKNKYGNMVKSMSNIRAGNKSSGEPASKALSQVQAVGSRKLEREGAISNLRYILSPVSSCFSY
jgi:hypothetical protein